jgi:hypothetical protein
MTEAKAAILVRLSPALKAKLVELAQRERRSLSKQVELLLEHSLSQWEEQEHCSLTTRDLLRAVEKRTKKQRRAQSL